MQVFDNIILIGFMGSGKDVVGETLADKTGMRFLSTDKFIELEENRSIQDIFEESGEEYFRDLEKTAIQAFKDIKNSVVATGGGMVLDEENCRLIASMGTTIHLNAEQDIIEAEDIPACQVPVIQHVCEPQLPEMHAEHSIFHHSTGSWRQHNRDDEAQFRGLHS